METNTIYECRDHREFLRRYLDQPKAGGGIRALARKAGFKSPGHLAMLVNGERSFTPRSADLLARALALKGRKRTLFLAYAKVEAAKSERERAAARAEVLRLKSVRPEHQLSAKQYVFLAVWYYPVLFVLIHQREGSQDPAHLAQRLGRGVTSSAVAKALENLAELGLIERDGSGRWQPRNAALTTPEDVESAAIAQYHRNTNYLAEQAMELPMHQREFNGLTVSVPDHLLPAVKERIRRFRSELNEMLAPETGPAEVYQLNLHLFPLTQSPERKSP